MDKQIYILVAIAGLVGVAAWYHQKKSAVKNAQKTLIDLQNMQAYIEQTLDKKSDFFADEGVIKVTIPRSDVSATIHQTALNPFLGMSSWVAFQKGKKPGVDVMAMGDFVLLEHEVNHVMSCALDNGISITALHNHMIFDTPKILFMHIEIEGKLAATIQAIKAMLNSYVDSKPMMKKLTISTQFSISAKPLEDIFTVAGSAKDGMFKVVIGRHTHAGCGCRIGKNMGINSWAAFAGSDDQAMVIGDLAVHESELQSVVKSLRSSNVDVMAIHNHMIYDNPRMIFVHFCAYAPAVDLAKAIKQALDQTNSFKE